MSPFRSSTFSNLQGSHTRGTSLHSVLIYMISACLLFLCLLGIWNAHTPSSSSVPESTPVSHTLPSETSLECTPVSTLPLVTSSDAAPPSVKYITKSIQDIVPGDRVQGANPEVSDVERSSFIEPSPEEVYLYTLVLPKDDESLTLVNLLRSRNWLDSEAISVTEETDTSGETVEIPHIWLELPELGAVGWAELIASSSVEPFSTGRGNLVTGTFCHIAPQTLDLYIEDVAPIGCTPNHPFWSVDRQTFVEAGDLYAGEHVQLYSGETKRVIQKLARPGPELVYNIEVHGEHVYHVTTDGVLVHNMCASKEAMEGHHPIPKFMGGNKKQDLYKVDADAHRLRPGNYHSQLSAALKKKVGFSGNVSTYEWKILMDSTKGTQRQALDTLLEVSRKFDAEHGTEFTHHVWKQIMQKGFEVFP